MDRQQCDDEFYQLMMNSCYSQTFVNRVTCLKWARTYFDAVSSYSQSYFDGNNDCCKVTVKLTSEGN